MKSKFPLSDARKKILCFGNASISPKHAAYSNSFSSRNRTRKLLNTRSCVLCFVFCMLCCVLCCMLCCVCSRAPDSPHKSRARVKVQPGGLRSAESQLRPFAPLIVSDLHSKSNCRIRVFSKQEKTRRKKNIHTYTHAQPSVACWMTRLSVVRNILGRNENPTARGKGCVVFQSSRLVIGFQ